jgi:single-strand selective monofunctional uracil DNA glycosylase
MSLFADRLIAAATKLADSADRLPFNPPVAYVYNPLKYAWPAYQQYLQQYARRSCQVVLLGMNPGPWGMAQTGIPFGEVAVVRDWLRIDAPIGRPASEHPKRPIEGLACQRSEVSGRRLWGLFRQRFQQPKEFFAGHLVMNYCPLVFMADSARNLTPDKLATAEREALQTICDRHLEEILAAIRPKWLVGIGAYAEKCATRVAPPEVEIGRILHPSPASPAANRGWAEVATRQLVELEIWQGASG